MRKTFCTNTRNRDKIQTILESCGGNHPETFLIDSHQSNKPILMPSCMDVVSSQSANSSTIANPVSTAEHTALGNSYSVADLTAAYTLESSAQNLPRYIFSSYSSATSDEGALESPVRCHLVTDDQPGELTELVVMDTGIQTSAGVNHSFENQYDAYAENHVIEEIWDHAQLWKYFFSCSIVVVGTTDL